MGAPLIVPFNYQPAAIQHIVAGPTVFDTSYTVPAGKYAFVKDNFGGISIDGGVNYIGYYRTHSGSTTASGPTQFAYGEFAGNVSARCQVSYSGSNGGSFSRIYTGGKYANTITSGTGGGDTVDLSYLVANRTGAGSAVYGNASNFTHISGYLSRITNGTCSFNIYIFNGPVWSGWVPAGTVIRGFDFTATEYNVIS